MYYFSKRQGCHDLIKYQHLIFLVHKKIEKKLKSKFYAISHLHVAMTDMSITY